jgi:crossover junction endodeoxyribonuclease RuvC
MKEIKKRTILGIDPGTLLMGYAVVSQVGSAISFVDMDVLNMKKLKNPTEKLAAIHSKIASLIEKHRPDEVSIESPFYGKNPQSLIKLGRAQGVAIAAAMSKGIEVFEYAPRKIKMSITGRGVASKEQVWAMLCRILSLGSEMQPKYMDASDALGVAVCHCLQFRVDAGSGSNGKAMSNSKVNEVIGKVGRKTSKGRKNAQWQEFIVTNPKRIV